MRSGLAKNTARPCTFSPTALYPAKSEPTHRPQDGATGPNSVLYTIATAVPSPVQSLLRRAYWAAAESVSGGVVVQGAIRSRVNFPK